MYTNFHEEIYPNIPRHKC